MTDFLHDCLIKHLANHHTQSQVSDHSGVPIGTLNRFVSTKGPLQFHNFEKLCKYLSLELHHVPG